jgi:hypothetical protein
MQSKLFIGIVGIWMLVVEVLEERFIDRDRVGARELLQLSADFRVGALRARSARRSESDGLGQLSCMEEAVCTCEFSHRRSSLSPVLIQISLCLPQVLIQAYHSRGSRTFSTLP